MDRGPLSRLHVRHHVKQYESWLVEKYLGCGMFHMLIGDSGAGKTTWLMQMLRAWEKGLPIYGQRSYPKPWVYIPLDRGNQDTCQTIERVDPTFTWDVPIYPMSELARSSVNGYSIETIMNNPLFKDVELFVIEGLQGLTPDPRPGQNLNKLHLQWMAYIRETWLEGPNKKTILAVTHRPKHAGKGEKGSMRNEALGSATLMACANTMIKVEEVPKTHAVVTNTVTGERESDQRIVYFNGKFKPFSVLYDIDENGLFVNEQFGATLEDSLETPDEKASRTELMDMWLLSQPDSQTGFTTGALEQSLMTAYGISRITVHRWIKSAVQRKILTQFDRGRYRKRMEFSA